MKTLKRLFRQDRERFSVPKCAQDVIVVNSKNHIDPLVAKFIHFG